MTSRNRISIIFGPCPDCITKIQLNRTTVFLLLIVAAGLALRLWGIDFGLPFSYANDEYHEVMRALELGSGGFNLERTGKGGFYYLLLLEYGIYFVWLKLTGVVQSSADFARHIVRDPSALYYMGRVTAAAFGALTIALVFAMTRKAFSVGAAFFAAIFVCANALHVDLSHRIGVDVPLACLTAAALYFALRLAIDGIARDYKWAALFAALATTTKLPGILLAVPLLTAHILYVRRSGGSPKQWLRSRDLWISVGLFALVLIVTNPGILFDKGLLSPFAPRPDDARAGAFEEGEFLVRPNLFVFYFDVMRASMGWPLFVASLAGLGYAMWKRTAADWVLVPFAVIFYVVIASTSSDVLYYPRYVLPILVVLAALAARLLCELWQNLARSNAVVATAVIGAVIAVPTIQAVREDHVLTKTDTRTLAKDWIEQNVPAGSRILIEGLKINPVKGTVQLQDTAEAIERRIAYWRKVEPKQAKFLQLELQVLEGRTFDLELIHLSDAESLETYERRGVEYFVVRPARFLESRRSDGGSVKLLKALRTDPRVTLVKKFSEQPLERPGPELEIYRLIRRE